MKHPEYLAIGIGVGVALGVTFNDIAIGIALGVAIGLALSQFPFGRPPDTSKNGDNKTG